MLKKFGFSIVILAAPALGLYAQTSSSCAQVQTALAKLKLAIEEAAALVQMDPNLNTPDLQASLISMNQAIAQDTGLVATLNCGVPAAAAAAPPPVHQNLPPVCAQALSEIWALNAYRAGLSVVIKNPPQGSTAADIQHNQNAKTQVMAKLKALMQTLTANGCK